jgi:hypothetical protein
LGKSPGEQNLGGIDIENHQGEQTERDEGVLGDFAQALRKIVLLFLGVGIFRNPGKEERGVKDTRRGDPERSGPKAWRIYALPSVTCRPYVMAEASRSSRRCHATTSW